jgi:hypothetical protein
MLPATNMAKRVGGQGEAVLESEDLGGVGAAAAEGRHGDVPSPRIDPA